MTREDLMALLSIEIVAPHGYGAFLPEYPLLWAAGKTEEEARMNWLLEYDMPLLWESFEAVWRDRAAKCLGPYHLDKWHQGMTDQELRNVCSNLTPLLQEPLSFGEYEWDCLGTLLSVQVEQVLRLCNEKGDA